MPCIYPFAFVNIIRLIAFLLPFIINNGKEVQAFYAVIFLLSDFQLVTRYRIKPLFAVQPYKADDRF